MKNRKTTLRKIILTGAMLIALISNATNGLNNDPKKDLNKTTFTLKNVKQGNQLIIKDLYGLIFVLACIMVLLWNFIYDYCHWNRICYQCI